MAKIKICGMMREEDIKYINEYKPDYTGFIFAKGRRRYISPETAKSFKSMLDPSIEACGVFVNEDVEYVAELANDNIFDIIQLHGQEDEAYISGLRELTDKPIIKAFKISSTEDIDTAVKSSADYILLDNGIGGTGDTFDWSLFKQIDRPFFLAGGIGPDNAKESIELMNPYAIDASSSLETEGYKDKSKIAALIKAVRE